MARATRAIEGDLGSDRDTAADAIFAAVPTPGAGPARHYRPAARVLVRALGDEAVLLDLDRGFYFGLNSTGLKIWESLAAGHTERETVDRLVESFVADPAALAADVHALLEELERNGLLVADGGL